MRLIDADELFENVGKIKPRNKEHYKSIGEFMNMITNTSTTEKWTPVSERLPEENGNYIVSLEDAVDTSAKFFNGKWFMSSIDSIAREYGEYEVFAWMPPPEPYKESEE